jgi:hypothetical protein
MFHWPKADATRTDEILIECVVFDEKDQPVHRSRAALARFLPLAPGGAKASVRGARPGAI